MINTHKKIFSRLKRLFLNNPTIMCQLSIAPMVLIGITLSNAISISVAMTLVTIPTLIIMSLIGNKLHKSISLVVCLLISSLIYIPTAYFMKIFFFSNVDSLGIYLPMTVINSIIIISSRNFMNNNKVLKSFFDSLVYVAVFCIEICLISVVREILWKGNIGNYNIDMSILFTSFSYPFMGFILIGLLAALIQMIYNNRSKLHFRIRRKMK